MNLQPAQIVHDFSTVVTADKTGITSACSDITFDNTGDIDVTINSAYILAAGKSLSLDCNQDSIIVTSFNIAFTGTQTGTKRVNVIRATKINNSGL